MRKPTKFKDDKQRLDRYYYNMAIDECVAYYESLEYKKKCAKEFLERENEKQKT